MSLSPEEEAAEHEYYQNLYKPAHEKEELITDHEVLKFVNGFKILVESGATERELAIYALREKSKLPHAGPMG